MIRRIPNGACCLFRANPGGTRQGKVVVVQHRAIEDPDHGGSFTIKLHQSEGREVRRAREPAHRAEAPDQRLGYKDIVLENELEDLKVIGEFLTVL
ncbi:hypothetical protein ACGK9R_08535 [Halomonas sp. HNIBRBA4712]|uniref:hypothetical protein n=1 Tax=Halomonas sp. HNIBRBA4712 TaxID=3373087 RepID=UPI0037466AB9